MKRKHFKILILLFSITLSIQAQQFTKPLQEFKVGSNTEISIEASYAEIEIIEWNKNKVEVEGIMTIQGLPEDEAQDIFDSWDISAQANADKISIRSSSSNFGNEYFFINSDKYIGNVIVDVPEISERVIDIIDSIHFVLPEFENFPDIEFEMNENFVFSGDSIAFDYEEQMKVIKRELKENQVQMARQQKEMQREIKEMQKEVIQEARLHVREAQMEAREVQRHVREENVRVRSESDREREHEVKRIIENRQKVKIKRTLIIKVPRNAKLEMDVDYCKISTIK